MSIIVLDAGHGGDDRGGQSLGTPESHLVLPYALELGRELGVMGHQVLQTRTADTYPTLSARARLANDAGADLFVSLHANASASPDARGPWTIHAAGSVEGRRYAAAAQDALVRALGGSRAAIYPDASPWVDNRRLVVLRQTRMPAVLLELGFMTNTADLAQLESAETRHLVCTTLARALHQALTGRPQVPPPPDPLEVEIPIVPMPDFADRPPVELPEVAPPEPRRDRYAHLTPPSPVPTFAPAPRPTGWRRFIPSFLRRGITMRAVIGRIAAVLAGAIITFLAGALGVEVTEQAHIALTEGLTMIGMFVWLLAYAVAHRLISRRINPSDSAA